MGCVMARKKLIATLFAVAVVLGLAVTSSADICNGFGTCGGGGHHKGSGGGGLPASGGPTLSISDAIRAIKGAPSNQGGKGGSDVFEGDTCQFTVKLKDGTKIATADWTTKNGTAVADGQPGDYDAASGEVTIDPKENTNKYFIYIHTNNDPFPNEGNETFFVVLSHAHNAVITDPKGKCVIHDDSPPPPTD